MLSFRFRSGRFLGESSATPSECGASASQAFSARDWQWLGLWSQITVRGPTCRNSSAKNRATGLPNCCCGRILPEKNCRAAIGRIGMPLTADGGPRRFLIAVMGVWPCSAQVPPRPGPRRGKARFVGEHPTWQIGAAFPIGSARLRYPVTTTCGSPRVRLPWRFLGGPVPVPFADLAPFLRSVTQTDEPALQNCYAWRDPLVRPCHRPANAGICAFAVAAVRSGDTSNVSRRPGCSRRVGPVRSYCRALAKPSYWQVARSC